MSLTTEHMKSDIVKGSEVLSKVSQHADVASEILK